MGEELKNRTGGVAHVTRDINSNVQQVTFPKINEAKQYIAAAKEEIKKQKSP